MLRIVRNFRRESGCSGIHHTTLEHHVYSTLCSLQQIVVNYKLHVYSTLDDLQQIVDTIKLQVYNTLDGLLQIVGTLDGIQQIVDTYMLQVYSTLMVYCKLLILTSDKFTVH